MAKAKNTTRKASKSRKRASLPALPCAPKGWTIKKIPRGKGPVIPDVGLMQIWAFLGRQLDVEYSHWLKSRALKVPMERKLDRLRRAHRLIDKRDSLGFDRAWEKRQAVYAAFERTSAGKKAEREYEAYNAACKISHEVANAMLRRQPKTIAGAAVFSIAAFYESDWAGFGFRADGIAAARIVLALSQAAGLRLPNSVLRMVS